MTNPRESETPIAGPGTNDLLGYGSPVLKKGGLLLLLSEAFDEVAGEFSIGDGPAASEFRNALEAGVRDLERALVAETAKREELERRHESAETQLIDERDAAEAALSQAYFLIIGQSPEWSNLFGHDEAVEEIDDAQRAMRERIISLESERDALKAENAAQQHDIDRYVEITAEHVAEIESLRAQVERLGKLLRRYRNETPLGHQPHMIAHEVDAALAREKEGG